MGDRTERNRRVAATRNKYNARTYENITFRARVDGSDGVSREAIKAAADAAGCQSVNQWIIEAIKEKL